MYQAYYGSMPEYKNNSDLPDKVKENLPDHAQDIYREAFNSAWEQYDEKEERQEGRTREETAHAVAWSAVENTYEKNENGEWVEK
jgi:cation transport regulator